MSRSRTSPEAKSSPVIVSSSREALPVAPTQKEPDTHCQPVTASASNAISNQAEAADDEAKLIYTTDFKKAAKNSIDFRRHAEKFNRAVSCCIKGTNDYVLSKRSKDEVIDKRFSILLDKVLAALIQYYTDDRAKDYTPAKAAIRAREVFSQFLQSMVYFIAHHVTLNSDSLISFLVSHPFFYYVSYYTQRKPEVIVHIDPKEGCTALNVLCRAGYTADVKKGFRKYISHQDNYNFSSFHAVVANAGNVEIMRLLLAAASQAFIDKPKKLVKLLNTKTLYTDATPLYLAVCKATPASKTMALMLIKHGADPDIKCGNYTARGITFAPWRQELYLDPYPRDEHAELFKPKKKELPKPLSLQDAKQSYREQEKKDSQSSTKQQTSSDTKSDAKLNPNDRDRSVSTHQVDTLFKKKKSDKYSDAERQRDIDNFDRRHR